MKRTLLSSLFCLIVSASFAPSQAQTPKGYYTVIPVKPADPNDLGTSTVAPLPLWNYSVTASAALGGSTYNGTIVGRSPYSHGKVKTGVPTQIIPLVITINDGTNNVTYDPTAADPCVPGHTDVDIITNSPIFTNTTTWTMNTVNVGTTQYIDAFQRAEFWSLVGGSPYHLVLNQTTLASQPLSFSGGATSGPGKNFSRSCGFLGVVQVNDLQAAVVALINGPLAATVNAGTFPIFLTRNVVSAQSGTDLFTNCCILGFHSGFFTGGNLQIYSPFSLDTSGTFGGDVSTLSHEMGEAIDDPQGTNPVPLWGHIGQQGGCQSNLENGDPLSPGFGSPTAPFTVAGNGLTYHMQELAFFSWFYGGTSLGAGSKYSDNNTFAGSAKLCPPGGTN